MFEGCCFRLLTMPNVKGGFMFNTRILMLVILLSFFSFTSNVFANTPTPIVKTTLDANSKFNDYIKALGVKTVLSDEDARTYSSDLNDLVGNYFYVDEIGIVNLLGRPDAIPKATIIQLKDKVEYQSATEKGSSISATLPWLSFLFKANFKTSILMQDIASVVGTSNPPTITANLPSTAPAGKQIWFISGATVTLVSATTYSNKTFEGSSVIQVGGNALYTKNILQNAWIISLNKVRANSIPQPVAQPIDKSMGESFLFKDKDPLAGKIVKIKNMKK